MPRYLLHDDIAFTATGAKSLTATALRTDGVLAEYDAADAVINNAAARGSKLAWASRVGSYTTIDDSNGGGSTPTLSADTYASIRLRKAVRTTGGLYNLQMDAPQIASEFTLMAVLLGGSEFAWGDNSSGANPFGLRLASSGGTWAATLGGATGNQALAAGTVRTGTDVNVLCVSAVEAGAFLAAHHGRYAHNVLAGPAGAFAQVTGGNIVNAARPIRLAVGSYTAYVRIANVAYTGAQLEAWRDYLLMKYAGTQISA